MRTMLLMVVIALAWAAAPAQAGDGDAEKIAALTASVARLKAENTHLREAYDQASANLSRATNAITRMTSSLNAATSLATTLRVELTGLQQDLKARPKDNPARLRVALRKARADGEAKTRALAESQRSLAAEQEAHRQDVAHLTERLNDANERASRHVVRFSTTESALARAREEHTKEIASLQEQLTATLSALRKLKADR